MLTSYRTISQLAPWIVWHIWVARNQLIFNGKTMTEEETLSKAIAQARKWQKYQQKTQRTQKMKTNRATQPLCSTRVSTDAAWKAATQTAGLGWILSNQESSSSFMRPVHDVRSALCAEALAMREALRTCKEAGVTCESDSALLIKAINDGNSPPELYGILADVFNLLCHFDGCYFRWISRESNSAADRIAKLCLVEEEAFRATT